MKYVYLWTVFIWSQRRRGRRPFWKQYRASPCTAVRWQHTMHFGSCADAHRRVHALWRRDPKGQLVAGRRRSGSSFRAPTATDSKNAWLPLWSPVDEAGTIACVECWRQLTSETDCASSDDCSGAQFVARPASPTSAHLVCRRRAQQPEGGP